MKIQILSDIHLECESFEPPVSSADIVILAGDVGVGSCGIDWAKNNFKVPVLYIPGNHEYHDPSYSMVEIRSVMEQSCERSNVILMDNNVMIIDGVRFIGTTLWTDLSSFESVLYCDESRIITDYGINNNEGGLHFNWSCAQTLFEKNTAWLQSVLVRPFGGKTVVVTHHAPSLKSIHPDYESNEWNSCFVSDLEKLMDGVDLWVHGHTHSNFDYQIGKTRVVCNPRGYPSELGGWENQEFNPSKVISI